VRAKEIASDREREKERERDIRERERERARARANVVFFGAHTGAQRKCSPYEVLLAVKSTAMRGGGEENARSFAEIISSLSTITEILSSLSGRVTSTEPPASTFTPTLGAMGSVVGEQSRFCWILFMHYIIRYDQCLNAK
jgi:hypothetical protein